MSTEKEAKPKYFIAQPGTPVAPHTDQEWVMWEVGDSRYAERMCVTSCEQKARLIADALEFYAANARFLRDDRAKPRAKPELRTQQLIGKS